MISASAPGRVELLGNHTDYNEGVVLAGAIDRSVTVTGDRLEGVRIVLHSQTLGHRVQANLRDLRRSAEEAWANYPLGVVHELVEAGLPLRGFAAEITSTLPPGGGLSSSAALEVATACFLLKLHELSLPPLELARLCQRAENRFAGVPCGLLDQASSVFGQVDRLVFLDCRTEEVWTVPFPPELALVVADSDTKHELLEGSYRLRREECSAAAALLHVKALRDATEAQLAAASLEPLLRRRAAHIIGENRRVWQAIDLLATGDGVAFGKLLNESHRSSRENFENSTAQLDVLVEEAQRLPGVLGARLTGGGFGGCTVTLVEAEHGGAVVERLAERYFVRTGLTISPIVCKLADGAIRL